MSKGFSLLLKVFLLITGTFFTVWGMSASQGFMAPLISAIVLALIVLPFCRKIEKLVKNRVLSSFTGTFLLLIFSLLFMALASFQIKIFFNDLPKIQKTMAPEIEEFKSFLFDHTPLDEESLQQYNSPGSLPFFEDGTSKASKALAFLRSSLNFVGVYILTLIYTFFLLLYRKHFKDFLLEIFKNQPKHEIISIIEESAEKVQDYLLGRLILMAILAVLYSIGLGFSGVDNFILVGIIASILTLIPWVGNIIGFAMAMAFGYLTSGDTNVLWGIVITFTVSQFFESYVLQPYIVGDKVGLHPFFVILFVILGGAIWGLIGMVLTIPVMAIVTVVLQNTDTLKPLGFLFSKESKPPSA